MSRRIWGELYRTDRDGVILEDLSQWVVAGTVEYSAEQSGGTPLVGRFTLSKADVLQPLRDFVSPFLVLGDERGTLTRQRIGVFAVDLPAETHTYRRATADYELSDLTSLLARGGSRNPRTIPTGTTFVQALTDLAGLVGLTRLALPGSTRTAGYQRVYPAGMTYLEQANKLCEAVAWYPLWMGLDGRLTTRTQQLLSQTTPITTLTTDDMVDEATVEPVDSGAVANIVVVTRDRGDQDPLEAIRVNDDPASETSTQQIGPRVYGGAPYNASDAETQADVDAIADRLIDEARSYERVVTVRVEPRFDVLGMWRTLELQVETAAGANLRGRYWINGWTVGFTPAEAAMELTLNRMVRFNRGEDR